MNRTIPRHPMRRFAAVAIGLTLLAACANSQAGDDHRSAGSTSIDKALHGRLPQRIQSSGVIRVGTDASYAPASFFARNGRDIVGFEPDLAAAMGRVLGVRFEFVNVEFTHLLPQLGTGKIDLAISAMTDTVDREKQADFVDYFSAGTSILVQRGNPAAIAGIQDLCGHVVAVEEGTVQVDLVRRSQQHCAGEPIQIRQYATNSDALLQLRTGRAVAVLNDFPPAAYLANDPKTKTNYQLASDTQYEPGPYGIAVSRNDSALRDVIRDALAEVMRSGAYAKALGTWGVSGGALQRTAINASGATSG
ncbi:MAG: ABC transporter substrate-binding protein [Actinomycetales bacterium]|jgi:polar amino acid transport system substrate-binding protein